TYSFPTPISSASSLCLLLASSETLSVQLLNSGPTTLMYTPWAGCRTCPPTPVYRILSSNRPAPYRYGQWSL
ncbi:hypothetical protein EV421DRAFT_1830416, partial [Armillaria borealis]